MVLFVIYLNIIYDNDLKFKVTHKHIERHKLVLVILSSSRQPNKFVHTPIFRQKSALKDSAHLLKIERKYKIKLSPLKSFLIFLISWISCMYIYNVRVRSEKKVLKTFHLHM